MGASGSGGMLAAADAGTGGARRPPRRLAVPNAVVGILVAIVVEIMVFAGFISAYLVARKPLPAILWPPPDQPRFPVEATAINSLLLILSGVACWLAVAAHRRALTAHRRAEAGASPTPTAALATPRRALAAAFLLGLAFVVLQGVEWAQLLADGLTLRSSLAGAYFYLLVGAHALHAIAGLMVLGWAGLRLSRGTLTTPQASAVRIYWTFVVALWPILYWLVYLS